MRDILVLSPAPAPPTWAIHSVTTDDSGKPTARKINAGSPSLMRLVPDMIGHWGSARSEADAIISSRPLDIILASLAPADAEHLGVGDLDIQIACPVGGSRPELWTWLHRPGGGELRFPGREKLFVLRMLARELACLFNPPNIVTEGAVVASSKLDAITRGEEKLEAWIMPRWRAKLMLPAAFPEIAPIPRPSRPPQTSRQRLDDMLRETAREKQKARSERSAREADHANARAAEKRKAERDAETRAGSREAAIRARVESELRR
jgi:hypothetical protein